MVGREWNEKFKQYIQFIISNPVYKGLFIEKKKDGTPKWVVAGKSVNGLKRRKWWNNQCNKYGIKIEAGCYAKVALVVHPTKMHTCQICGKELSIEYIYPNKRLLGVLLKYFNKNYESYSKDIYEILEEIKNEENLISVFKKVLKTDEISNYKELVEFIIINHIKAGNKGLLSPGAMSNSPDRFDGFHSDGACCRHKSDKGRSKENLRRYTQDRRVYENWVEGDWKKADRLMASFGLNGVSADHIGPISLGFCHRPKFNPMSKEDNSSKGNRMSYEDVTILIEDEKTEKVISWYGKYLWDELKNKVNNDDDSIKLSDLLSKNTFISLSILSLIHLKGFSDFLIKNYLYPNYSFFDHKIIGFNPTDGTYENIETIKVNRKEQHNNVERYIRIALETLEEYSLKDNRKNIKYIEKIDHGVMEKIFILLESEDYINADKEIKELIKAIGEELKKEW